MSSQEGNPPRWRWRRQEAHTAGAERETDRLLRLRAAWGEEAGTSLCQAHTAGQEMGWCGAQFPWGN